MVPLLHFELKGVGQCAALNFQLIESDPNKEFNKFSVGKNLGKLNVCSYGNSSELKRLKNAKV